MPTSNKTQARLWHVIINFQLDDSGKLMLPLDELEIRFEACLADYLEEYPCFYAWIIHDEPDEIPHIHMILWKTKRHMKSTLINNLAYHLNTRENCITVSAKNSLDKELRYLIHLDDPDKFQGYLPSDVHTNEPQRFENACMYGGIDYTGQDLYDIIQKFEFDEKRVAIFLGPQLYSRYYRFVHLFCNH